ncbi:sigma-E factor negative regulatory protein [Deefgea tanakiae]|jgi:sigma-E factor negative regulatory protein RseA|uniref:Sigma-E factor negative regulatory protein n=1 Tax=Deefgea tanakiae TaxID=2865840 RepID=A0ABX8Z8B6_9NEIS|nr:sigma-E factor negative regulatory protein [Deefgea tanakiae]QZA78819.1 sigma-E factor negative regulatory protein [Deefgea tanakiae]
MNEKISALIDCEVDQKEASKIINELLASSKQQNDWYSMHAARDAMQGYPVSPDFMTKFSARLAQEPVIVAPNRIRKSAWMKPFLIPATAVASVMFVGLAVWQFSMPTVTSDVGAMAKVEAPAIPSSEISPYLVAHRDGLANSMATEQFALAHFEAGEQR